ncbi:MAG TPA: DUF2892 domain-containing protein [Clostridia bacterium]|nr:DUF2892 domain-containing protein [Clostridia bacterium]
MKNNMSSLDRIIRIVVGVALLSLIVFLSGGIRWIGLIGLIPLLTGIAGFCPLYALFKIKTN